MTTAAFRRAAFWMMLAAILSSRCPLILLKFDDMLFLAIKENKKMVITMRGHRS